MKKFLAALSFVGLSAGLFASTTAPAKAGDDDVAAIILSAAFSGGFPFVECIVGYICPCVKIASVIDAAAGKTDDGMRFDFWSSPN